MVSTLDIPEVVLSIPTLFDRISDKNGKKRYEQVFYGATSILDARRFAEGLRKQCGQISISGEFVDIEQRNDRVIITVNIDTI